MLIFLSEGRREWFYRGPDVPKSLFPREAPTKGSYAADLILGDGQELSGEVYAEAWFDHWSAADHWIQEHSVKIWDGLMLSLLWWQGAAEQMLIRIDEYEEKRDARRSDDFGRR